MFILAIIEPIQNMKGSKLILLLKTFNSKELRAFGDYLKSPFFNKNKELVDLFFYLKKCAPLFAEKKIKKDLVYKRVFQKSNIDVKHLHYVMSFLLKLAEEFVSHIEYQGHNGLPDYHLLVALSKRNLEKNYNHALKKAESRLEINEYQNTEFYFHQYLIADVNNRNFQGTRLREYDASLQKASDYFDLFFIANKMKYLCEMLDRQNVLVADYNLKMLHFVKAYLTDEVLNDNSFLDFYYCVLLLQTEESSDKYFTKLKLLIQTRFDELPLMEQKQIFFHAINYTIRKIREGKDSYLSECLELYEFGIKMRFVFDDNYLSPWTFKNVVRLALRLKRFVWTKNFIEQNYQLLKEEFQDDQYNFALAEYYFLMNNFTDALLHLNFIFNDIQTILGARTRILQIYYETDELDALDSGISSFRQFLYRNKKVSKKIGLPYRNFVTMLTELIKHNLSSDKLILHEKITTTSILAGKQWLLDKLNNL